MSTSALVVLGLQFDRGRCGYVFCPGGLLCAGTCTPRRTSLPEDESGFLVVSKEDPKLVHFKNNPRMLGVLCCWSWCAWSGW